jgi:hypothetical protein
MILFYLLFFDPEDLRIIFNLGPIQPHTNPSLQQLDFYFYLVLVLRTLGYLEEEI